jgi:polyphenol oxidase
MIIVSQRKDGDMRYEENVLSFCKKNKIDRRKLFLAEQVHGKRVEEVKTNDRELSLPRTDGLFTFSPDIFLGVRTADCLPIVFFSEKCCGVLHAGWRGLANGIIENSFFLLKEKGVKGEELSFKIGPGIESCHFEIKKDIFPFFKKDKNFYSSLEKKRGKIFFDLKGFAERKIKKYNPKEINTSKVCTFCSKQFFSYRREKNTGTVITIVKK